MITVDLISRPIWRYVKHQKENIIRSRVLLFLYPR